MTTQAPLTATVDDLLAWKPCSGWTEEAIREIAGDKREWTALEVLALERVPAADRLWIVLRPELIPEPLVHEIAYRFAEEVLPIWESQYPDDLRPRDAIATKRRWMRGEAMDQELAVAEAAAWAAARAAALIAAWDAARPAAAAAAQAAAHAAAWDAAHAAARDAAHAAAWAAARARQVEIVRQVLEDQS